MVIMAGGQGTRLKHLTRDTPKPMLKVGDRPILETIIDNFKLQGFRDFYLAVNYRKEKILDHFGDGSKFGVSIEYIHEENYYFLNMHLKNFLKKLRAVLQTAILN